jgi:hypothetical protein
MHDSSLDLYREFSNAAVRASRRGDVALTRVASFFRPLDTTDVSILLTKLISEIDAILAQLFTAYLFDPLRSFDSVRFR